MDEDESSGRIRWRQVDGHVDLAGGSSDGVRRFAATPQPVIIDPKSTALVVVDMVNDFCNPAGLMGSYGMEVSACREPIPLLAAVLPIVRAAGMPVIWVNWGVTADMPELPPGVIHIFDPFLIGAGFGMDTGLGEGGALIAGSGGTRVVEGLEVDATDITVSKHRLSGFYETRLASVLRNRAVTTLLFAGVNADQCVLFTMKDAADHGFNVVMLEDCCATTSPDYCWDSTLYNVRTCIGFTALSSDLAAGLEVPSTTS